MITNTRQLQCVLSTDGDSAEGLRYALEAVHVHPGHAAAWESLAAAQNKADKQSTKSIADTTTDTTKQA